MNENGEKRRRRNAESRDKNWFVDLGTIKRCIDRGQTPPDVARFTMEYLNANMEPIKNEAKTAYLQWEPRSREHGDRQISLSRWGRAQNLVWYEFFIPIERLKRGLEGSAMDWLMNKYMDANPIVVQECLSDPEAKSNADNKDAATEKSEGETNTKNVALAPDDWETSAYRICKFCIPNDEHGKRVWACTDCSHLWECFLGQIVVKNYENNRKIVALLNDILSVVKQTNDDVDRHHRQNLTSLCRIVEQVADLNGPPPARSDGTWVSSRELFEALEHKMGIHERRIGLDEGLMELRGICVRFGKDLNGLRKKSRDGVNVWWRGGHTKQTLEDCVLTWEYNSNHSVIKTAMDACGSEIRDWKIKYNYKASDAKTEVNDGQ